MTKSKAFYPCRVCIGLRAGNMHILHMSLILSEWFFHLLISKFYIIVQSTEYWTIILHLIKDFYNTCCTLLLCSYFHWFSLKSRWIKDEFFYCLWRKYEQIAVKFDVLRNSSRLLDRQSHSTHAFEPATAELSAINSKTLPRQNLILYTKALMNTFKTVYGVEQIELQYWKSQTVWESYTYFKMVSNK